MIRFLVCSVAMFVLGTGTAVAHVTAHTPDSPPEKGGYGTVVLRVPNEETVATTRIEVTIPPAHGITTARTRPLTGWIPTVRRGPGGVVTAVEWTARPGSELAGGDAHYEDFGLTMGPLPSDVDTLVLPTTQFLANGGTVAWNDQPDRPAPVVTLTEPSGAGHHGERAASAANVPWIAVASLVGLSVVLAVGGVLLFRRREIS
ncbi:YcnI family protein [Lentzea albidocapillata]|uniref:Uncharacterized protein YcnI n=1 Tax=Lentzea albidocapillata TaxID=40571 RepID=A0A1W2FJ37_9PSEU|nr:YcnI family protein [Lentzea albidocapillata]SMD22025.1 Uncharacterized protein YcnI [Lentzea albidocapillata]